MNTVSKIWLVLVLWLLVGGNGLAGTITVAWNPSNSKNVGGYRLYYGASSNSYTASVDTGTLTTFTLTGLTDGATYFMAVKAYDLTGTAESAFSNEISATISNPAVTLTANFTATATSGTVPLSTTFTPVTTGAVTGWLWDFGAANLPNSTSKNPTVTYSTTGLYDVSLTVTSATSASATLTKQAFINAAQATPLPPTANFTASPLSGNAPMTVAFNDASIGTISAWSWNFGDGNASALKNPSHVYSTPGAYPISLTVTGPGGSHTKTLAGTIVVNPAAPAPNNGLIAAYGFEENNRAIIADASGLGNHGRLKEAVRVSPGRYGKALFFDGLNDWVTINDSASLKLGAGYTLEAWVRQLSPGFGTVIAKENLKSASYSLYASHNADLPTAFFNDSTNNQAISGKALLPLNQWVHLVSTYNGQSLSLYVNGILAASRPQTGLISPSFGVLRIGGNSALQDFFHGYIDEVKIYNRALTAAEITKNFSTAVSIAKPMVAALGTNAVLGVSGSIPAGIAKAFAMSAQKNAVITYIKAFVDANSTTTELFAGLYSDNNGHPGKLLIQGKIINPVKNSWNSVPIPSIMIEANQKYWLALLSAKGQINLRSGIGNGSAPSETSAVPKLTSLPDIWTTGSIFPSSGAISAFAAGYAGP